MHYIWHSLHAYIMLPPLRGSSFIRRTRDRTCDHHHFFATSLSQEHSHSSLQPHRNTQRPRLVSPRPANNLNLPHSGKFFFRNRTRPHSVSNNGRRAHLAVRRVAARTVVRVPRTNATQFGPEENAPFPMLHMCIVFVR